MATDPPDQLDAGSESYFWHLDQATKLEEAGDFSGALEHVDALLGRGRNSPGQLVRRGRLLHALGRLEESVAAYERARDISPKSSEAQRGLVEVLDELQAVREAGGPAGSEQESDSSEGDHLNLYDLISLAE